MDQAHLFEMSMLICFGASWPFALYKTWKTKTSHGKSLLFLWLVFLGYWCGVASKVLTDKHPILYLYMLNSLMVLSDLLLCYRYRARALEPEAPVAEQLPAE